MSKTRMGKRVASLLLSLVMMFSLLPTTVYAEGADTGDTTDAVVEETIAPVNAEGVDAVAQEAESSGDEQPDGADNVTSSAVAKIGDKEYATLAGAIADVQDGQTVTLTANVEVADLTLDKTVTIKSEGETQYEIKGLKAIAGTGVTLDNVYLNLTQTLEIGGTNTTLTNCTIRAKDLGYNDVASGEYKSAFGYTNGYSYLTRVTGTNVTMTGCVIDGTDNGDEGYFPNMCLMPTSATNVTIKGCTFNEGWAAIYYGAISGKVEIDSCKFQNIYAYSVNVSEGTDTTVTIKDSTLAGWSSFGSKLNSVTFGNCKFTKELNGYASAYSTVATYTDTVFNNCTFTEDFAGVNTAGNENGVYVDSGAKANVVVEMNGCTVVKNDGSESGKNIKDVLNTDKMGAGTTAVVAIDAVKDANGKYVSGTFVGEKTAITNVIAADSTYDATTGTVTPATTNAVAKIGDTKYASLTEAVAAAKDGATVTLLADAKEDVVINKSITLDLGGKTLTNTNAGKATISVSNGATATVKNGSVVGGTSYYNIEVTKGSNANLTLESVTATAGNTGSSMIDNWGTLTINSGTYTGGLDTVKSEEGSTLTITGGTFTLDYATNGYTAVILVYGDTTITGGEFTQSLTTTGRWNHPQVIATGVVEGYTAITRVTGGRFVNKMSGEGIFRGVGKGTSDNFEVSGGTFNKAISDAFCADGFIPTKNADGTYGVKEGQYVAKVGDKKYETLQEAINAAANGATVTLLADCESDRINLEDKSITVDLNGKTLTSTAAYGVMFCAKNGNTITVNGTTEGSRLVGTLMVTAETDGHIVINGGIYESAKYCPIYINGAVSSDSSTLTVKDATITALSGDSDQDNGVAVYLAGYSTSTFTKTTITAPVTGLEIRAGKLTLTDCTVTGGSGEVVTNANGNGTTVTNAAVAISQHTTKKDIDVTITGGTYTAKAAVYQTNVQGTGSENVKVSITSGTFEGAVSAETNNTVAVSGGSFTSAVPENCCAEGFVPTQNDDGTYGVREANYVAEVSGTKYESLAEAIEAASRNATVKLLANTKENVTISTPYVTLDLNGHTLNGSTGERKPALTVTARVTVKDSSAAQTGTIMREDTAGNSGVSSHYVIDIQGAGWLTFESGNVKNDSGAGGTKGASLVRVGSDSVAKYPGLNIKGGTFTQDNFIVIKVERGDLFLNGGSLNSANSYAVQTWHRATIKGGTVNGNVSSWTYDGGPGAETTISGGTVNGNVEAISYDGKAGKPALVSISGGTVNGTLIAGIYNSATEPTKDMATIKITGGTFDKDPTKYVVEGSTVKTNTDGTFGVEKAYLAKVGDSSYYTMDEAFKAQTASGKPIVLLRNYTTGSTFNSGTVARVVDLNGHTWTCTGTDANSAAFEINNPNATLTVKNGKVVSSQLVGLIPSAMGGTIKYDNSSLMFEGVEMSTTATSGIETNGNNTNDSVTLKNSTLNVPNGFGIYFPSSGTLTIENSTINAKTMGVQVCSGSLSINEGSAITVSGGPVEKTENDGAIQDGAAISIVNRTGYKGLDKIEVTGGKFTAKTGNAAIKAYNWENKTESTFDNSNNVVAVSGGTFSSAVKEEYCATGYIPTTNSDGTYGVKPGSYVAETNGVKYETLQAAIDAASHRNGGQTEVTLLCNVTIKETVTFAKEFSAGSVLLNLGGYTLTGEGCRALQINRGSLYLENGTVTSTGIVDSSSVIRIGSNEATYNGATPMLHMQKDAKVVAPESYGVTIFGSATRGEKLKVMSNAEIIATGPSPAISGNGGANYNTDDRTSGWKAEEIIIGENAVISAANNYAIYHPECGTLNIQGGTITGTGGIQMCSGTLKISNSPKITANGSADYDYTGDAGVVYDAAAISVINRGYPQGPATATIKGTPTVTAANGEVIHAFTWSNSNKTDGKWAEAGDYINVSGGTYNKQFNEAYLAADCTLVTSSEGGYTVDQKKVAEYNGTQYTSLALAVRAANETGGTVKLLDNVTLTNSLGIGGTAAVTLNLNKKTLTFDGAQIYTQGSANVIIDNGTIKRIDKPTSGSASNFAIQVMSGSSLIIGTGMYMYKPVTIESTYGIYNVGGKLNARYTAINTNGWSIAVNDSATKTGEVEIGLNATTKITSQSGNCIGTAVNSKPNVTIHKGTLTSNGTGWDAGVIYWASEGTLTIEGGTFTASSAEGSEAAAVYQKNGTVKISGATTKLLGNNALVVKAGDGSTGEMVTELSGGTYSTKPDEAWVVEGKEIHETDKGYKVEGPYVVEVTLENGTTTKFDSWLGAFTSSQAQYNNATVKLLADIETDTVVKTFATVTIDFNGHTLTVKQPEKAAETAAITLLASSARGTAHVTLKDSSEAANGGMKTVNVYGVTVKGSNTTLTVENGNYNCDTSVVQVEKPVSGVATAYIKGGTFQTEDADKSYLLNCIDEAFKDGTAKMEVTGGTFHGFDPSANPESEGTSYVAEGYVSELTPSGAYEVVEAVYVAAIGDKQYTSLANAFAAANEGDTVKLIANFTTDATKTEAADRLIVKKSITLDLNGYTMTIPGELERSSNWAAFYINEGTLTVKDSTKSTGAIIGADKTEENPKYRGGVYLFHLNGGDLVIENGTFYAGCTVANVQKGTATVDGGSFAVYVDEGEDSRYLLNCIDANYKNGTARIVVNGGTFVGYDPRNNAAEGEGTNFVAVGVGVDANTTDGTFTALPNMVAQRIAADNSSVKAYATLPEAIEAAQSGETVQLLNAIETSSTIKANMATGVTLDLKGFRIDGSTIPEDTADEGVLKLTIGDKDTTEGVVRINGSAKVIKGKLPLVFDSVNPEAEIGIVLDKNMRLETTIIGRPANKVRLLQAPMYLDDYEGMGQDHYQIGGVFYTSGDTDRRVYESLQYVIDKFGSATLLHSYETGKTLTIPADKNQVTLQLSTRSEYIYTGTDDMIEVPAGAVLIVSGSAALKALSAKSVIHMTGSSDTYGATIVSLDGNTLTGGKYGVFAEDMGWNSDETRQDKLKLQNTTITANDMGVYFSSNGATGKTEGNGSLWIQGSTIRANTGVQVSADSELYIDSSITATGNGGGAIGNGPILDGAAVSIIKRGETAVASRSISGGTFISAGDVSAVQTYDVTDTGKTDWTPDTGFITGGRFSTDVGKYCAIDYRCNAPAGNETMYTVTKMEKISMTRKLTLAHDLIVTYTAKVPDGYTAPYAAFSFENSNSNAWEDTQVAGTVLKTEEGFTYYTFAFTGINPQRMTNTLKTKIYATNSSGQVVALTGEMEDSVAKYCATVIEKYNTAGTWTELISNLVAYGTASQQYMDYNLSNLVSSYTGLENLTTTDYSGKTGDIASTSGKNSVDGGVTIRSVSVVLTSSFAVRLYFTLDADTELNTVKFTAAVGGKTTEFIQFNQDESGRYYFDYVGLNAQQLDSEITFASFVGENADDTVGYSVNTYLAQMLKEPYTGNEPLNGLVKALFNYGWTCKNFGK